MTKNEAKMLDDFLAQLEDVQGNAGCNDMKLSNTPENRRLVYEAQKWGGGEEDPLLEVVGGVIITSDFIILGYLREKLAKEQGTR